VLFGDRKSYTGHGPCLYLRPSTNLRKISGVIAKLVDKGMVLYAMYGATSGEVAISKIKGAINQAILAMDASDMAANRFIAYWLRRQKKSITETFLQGGQGNLSGAIIKELGIPQPSLDEQRQIGSFFSNLDDLITLHQRKRLWFAK
ncbi:restriction endonuclease subunit S, partial [Bifidobacterium longum]|uniref:restriction endonuclease subunit S n=1 Tax=Bifidobacterium longum TaxID=216816 RepID=UPI0020B72C32